MMWTAIQYVSGAASLFAFLAAVAAWTYRTRLKDRGRMIDSAPASERAALVQSALEFFHIRTENLTRGQQYNIAMEQIRARSQRSLFATVLIFLLGCLAAVTVAYVTFNGRAVEAIPGFDIAIKQPEFIKLTDATKVVVPIQFFPVENYETTTSTVFTGVVTIYDLDNMKSEDIKSRQDTCSEVKSCLSAKVFSEYFKSPLLVRASGDSNVMVNTILQIPPNVRNVLIYAEFHQREVGSGKRCVPDLSRPIVREGIPYLKVVDRHGATTGEMCIGALDQQIFKVSLS